MRWTIYSDSADLVVECARVIQTLAIDAHPTVVVDPIAAAAKASSPVALMLQKCPTWAELFTLRSSPQVRALMVLDGARQRLDVASDLGLFVAADVGPLMAGLAAAAVTESWQATTRGLPSTERTRLETFGLSGSGPAHLELDANGLLSIATPELGPVRLGSARDVGQALVALRAASFGTSLPSMPRVEGVDSQQVLDVILGPPRALSDPASKAALAVYDAPLPEEVLCASASRAAVEASRIGYPVRIALASPDLRAWEHPDLVADGIDTAARVKDVFRQIAALAKTRQDSARILGVTVSATTQAVALLRARVFGIGPGAVVAELGFADPHGRAAKDETSLVLPCRYEVLQRRLQRLRGRDLLFGPDTRSRRANVEQIADVLLRLAAFADDWRTEVVEIQLPNLALLIGGGMEIREACVVVSDAFRRSLESSG